MSLMLCRWASISKYSNTAIQPGDNRGSGLIDVMYSAPTSTGPRVQPISSGKIGATLSSDTGAHPITDVKTLTAESTWSWDLGDPQEITYSDSGYKVMQNVHTISNVADRTFEVRLLRPANWNTAAQAYYSNSPDAPEQANPFSASQACWALNTNSEGEGIVEGNQQALISIQFITSFTPLAATYIDYPLFTLEIWDEEGYSDSEPIASFDYPKDTMNPYFETPAWPPEDELTPSIYARYQATAYFILSAETMQELGNHWIDPYCKIIVDPNGGFSNNSSANFVGTGGDYGVQTNSWYPTQTTEATLLADGLIGTPANVTAFIDGDNVANSKIVEAVNTNWNYLSGQLTSGVRFNTQPNTATPQPAYFEVSMDNPWTCPTSLQWVSGEEGPCSYKTELPEAAYNQSSITQGWAMYAGYKGHSFWSSQTSPAGNYNKKVVQFIWGPAGWGTSTNPWHNHGASADPPSQELKVEVKVGSTVIATRKWNRNSTLNTAGNFYRISIVDGGSVNLFWWWFELSEAEWCSPTPLSESDQNNIRIKFTVNGLTADSDAAPGSGDQTKDKPTSITGLAMNLGPISAIAFTPGQDESTYTGGPYPFWSQLSALSIQLRTDYLYCMEEE